MSRVVKFVFTLLMGVFLNAGTASAGEEAGLLKPRSFPYALAPYAERIDVTFKVQLLPKKGVKLEYVLLQGQDGSSYKLNDAGKYGDKFAGDGIYGATVPVSTKANPPETCLAYLATAMIGKMKIESPVYSLCTTSLPVGLVDSNTKLDNLIYIDKVTSPAVADELLVRFSSKATEKLIKGTIASVGAKIIGGIPPRGLYQIRFTERLSLDKLNSYIKILQGKAEVQDAYFNRVGRYVSIPNDTDFADQHGLSWINADDAWDLGATGNGVTVTLLDSGIQTHPDLAFVGADPVDHGTGVAGVIAAITDNMTGIAGVARNSTLESFIVSPDAGVTIAEMVDGFQDVAASGTGEIVTAGFNITAAPPGSDIGGVDDQWDLCGAIEDVVWNGAPVAVVVSSAGDNNTNGFHYPARCNSNGEPADGQLVHKSLMITVMASRTCTMGCTPDTKHATSNFGGWVDVAAPGLNTRTLTNAGGYNNYSGTSMAMAHTAGVAAQLRSCGVALDQIQSRLQSTAPVVVPYSGGDAERIDAQAAVLGGNTAPTGVNISNASVNENTNTAGGFSVGTLSAVSTDICDLLTYSIMGGADAAFFSIGGASSNELLINAGVLDFEVKSSYAVTVRVTDVGGISFDQPLIVSVNNLAEAPVVNDQAFAINENVANGTSVGTVVASDPDGTAVTYSITGGNTGSAFAINAGSGQITVANNVPVDFEANPVFSLTVQVSDGMLTDTAIVTVNLNNLPDTGIPNPVIGWVMPVPFENYLDAFGNPYTRYRFQVTNWAAYPEEMFDESPALPPCGLNTSASRTWVYIYNGVTNAYIYGFCALGTPSDLTQIWFAIPNDGVSVPPPSIYITMTDRQTSTVYTSNVLIVP
jgi:hypothetical protein